MNAELSDAVMVTIVGQGYVGLPLAVAVVNAGHQVIGLEVDFQKVEALNSGVSHIEDISSETLEAALKSCSYRASMDFSMVSNSNIVIICVPTPLNDAREPDLSALILAVEMVAPHLSPGTLVISESTSYPGTARDLVYPIIKKFNPKNANSILLASAPERVDPGNARFNHTNTPRLVSGLNLEATRSAANFYRTFTSEVVEVSSPEIAETAKLLENTFRQVNIALVNEIAMICNRLGISVHEVIDAAATKPYGFMKFTPGAGVGGHCIPVDPSYLSWKAKSVGAPTRFIDLANEVNLEMPHYVGSRLLALITKQEDALDILILGVAYKSGVGDVRETPAEGVALALEAAGCAVVWHDPLVTNWQGRRKASLTDRFSGAIVVTSQPGMDISWVVAQGIPILDCTGSLGSTAGVTQL